MVNNQKDNNQYNTLLKYGIDLTALAISGKLDPVIGRDREIRRVIQVLLRRTKNNPILIGDPGVGKTAIVEGLAQRIASNDVPETLKNKIVINLNIGGMLAGAKYRGEFEERLDAVLKEIKESNGQIITFIDEFHTIVGAGSVGESSMDAGNMLKPMLARGELRMIGATTLNEFRENIEKDAALERRFQQVLIEEPGIEDTVTILRGLKSKYEAHHKVQISDDSLISAVKLSNRYITSRFQPDKSIDLIDEAASRLRMEIDSSPIEIDELKRNIDRLKIEKMAITKDKNKSNRLLEIEKLIQDKEKELNSLITTWEYDKRNINKMGELKEKLDRLYIQSEKAQREGKFDIASRMIYGDIPKLEEQIKELTKVAGNENNNTSMIREEVKEDDIAQIVALWTGIPVGRLLTTESKKLLELKTKLQKVIIGQEHAIDIIYHVILRSKSGLSDINKPIGSFMFLGSTGVGKTALAYALAKYLFDDEKNLIRLDMTEYSEKHSVARLIGAPPGYIGYEQGGQLTEAVKVHPYSIVLLDEIEKAHSSIFDILLQIMDAGRLTDGRGKVVNFSNVILILTSNLGSQFLIEDRDNKTELVNETLRSHFRPEFLNRLDDVIIFNALDNPTIKKIVNLELQKLINKIKEKNLDIDISDDVIDWLAIHGYDRYYGVRPLTRVIRKEIENKIAYQLIDKQDSKHIAVNVLNNKINVIVK